MGERHLHDLNPLEISRELVMALKTGGVRGAMGILMSIGICPADDIAAIGATVVSSAGDAVVHQGSMPSEDQYRLKLSESDRRGKKIPRKLSPNFKKRFRSPL